MKQICGPCSPITVFRAMSRLAAVAAAACLLAGCASGGDRGTREPVEGEPAYEVAQQCVSIRHASGAFLATGEGGQYRLAEVPEADADRFFLKPSELGRFLLYDQDRGYLSSDASGLVRRPCAGASAVWGILHLEDGGQSSSKGSSKDSSSTDDVTLVTAAGDLRLGGREEDLFLGERTEPISREEDAFDLVERSAEDCAEFPEAALDAVVSPAFHEPLDPTGPVLGFADMHTHLNFAKALGGVALAGRTFHPFGIEHALGDCSPIHGPEGVLDFLGGMGSSGPHDTTGYPDFTDWPKRDTFSHMQAYYRWIERAYLSGLRIVVILATGNPTLCQALGLMRPMLSEGDCTPASTVELQTLYIYDVQDYVDAQEGGPGEGWFRVVTSPAEAREVIAGNKLAVVLGVEYGTLFDCREGQAKCTPDYVDVELEALHAMGVRVVFPIHRFDNAFGGTRPSGGDHGAWMNFASKMVTGEIDHVADLLNPTKMLLRPCAGGHFYEIEQCPEGVTGSRSLRSMSTFLDETFPPIGPPLSDLLAILLFDKLGPFPDYAGFTGPDSHACNVLGLEPVGRYLVHALMDRGMIIDLDHMSYYMMTETLDILEARGYSGVVSSHSWIESSERIRRRIFALGGMMSPFNGRPSSIASRILDWADEMADYPFPVAVGIGTDVMGVTSQTSADPDVTIDYPFTSHDGLVSFLPPKTGNRSFDYANGGLEHYGLLPEWVENLRQVDAKRGGDPGGEAMEVFMRSAEAYLQMWERAEAAAH